MLYVVCRSKNENPQYFLEGVSLIELILVVAIISILVVSYSSIGSSFFVRNQLQNKVNELTSSVRIAQINTISAKGNSRWGVTVTGGQIVLFKGDSYALRDPIFDEKYSIPSSISITPFEVVFEKLTGNSTGALTITVSSNLGESTQVIVNQVGSVDVQ